MDKVLIVEDEAITSLDLKLSLEDCGYEVVGVADTGLEAIGMATEKRPDVVLLDIQLKGDMTGIDVSEKISLLGIPVVFLTANYDEDTFFKANLTGSYGFIKKPFILEDIDYTLKLTIAKSKSDSDKINKAQGFFE